MKLGIIADTHDNLRAIKFLVNYFNGEEAQLLLHAGDFVAPFTIPPLAEFKGRVVGVFGNNDGDREMLNEMAAANGVELYPPPHRLEADGDRILLTHKPEDLPDKISPEIDLIISGHTHEFDTGQKYDHFWLNPGEAGGWLSGTTRGLLFETATGDIERISVPAP